MELFHKYCIQPKSLIYCVIFVDHKSYIIECNYCYWGIWLFLFTK